MSLRKINYKKKIPYLRTYNCKISTNLKFGFNDKLLYTYDKNESQLKSPVYLDII